MDPKNLTLIIRHTVSILIVGIPAFIAWGQVREKVDRLEKDKINTARQIEEVKKEVQDNTVKLGQIDERTKGIEKDVDKINRSLERILDNLQRPPDR